MPLKTFLRKSGCHLSMALVVCLLVVGCAPMITAVPANISQTASGATEGPIRLAANASIALTTGYTRTLADKSVWRPAGNLPQGTVYRPLGTVFTIEGRQVHEAYLVIRDRMLVGFYLPGESSYSPLSTAVPLTFGEFE